MQGARRVRERTKGDTYYQGECVHATHKPLCFIPARPKVHASVPRSLISPVEKYRGRFYKNRRRSGFHPERSWSFPAGLNQGTGRRTKRNVCTVRGCAGKSKRKGWIRVWGLDGSANLFYADLASPFDSPDYHCRGKKLFFPSFLSFFFFFIFFIPRTDDETFRAPRLCPGENVTSKSRWVCVTNQRGPNGRNYTEPQWLSAVFNSGTSAQSRMPPNTRDSRRYVITRAYFRNGRFVKFQGLFVNLRIVITARPFFFSLYRHHPVRYSSFLDPREIALIFKNFCFNPPLFPRRSLKTFSNAGL